jgi:hypothetical protein
MNVEELREQLEQLAGSESRATVQAREAVRRRVRRSRRRVSAGSAIAVALIVAIVAAGVRSANKPSIGVRTISTTTSSTATAAPAAAPQCRAGVRTVPAKDVPRDVRKWSGGRAVIGGGELWTARSAVTVVSNRQPDGSWLLKFPWFTRPFGLPRLDGRRLDGQGAFRGDANEAIDQRGKWVVSSLEFSTAGCWEVTARFDRATIRFRLLVGNPPRPLNIGTISGSLREVGGPAPGLNRTIGGVIRVSRSSIVWEDSTTGAGTFSVDLPVGTYTVTGTSPVILDGGVCSARGPVVVARGRTTRVDVICSIK